MKLLGQRVDAFGMATAEDKLAAIHNLTFPITLKALEKYLGLTGYLRKYISKYALVATPLQHCKTALHQGLRERSIEGNALKRATGSTMVDMPTPADLNAFHHLHKLFSNHETRVGKGCFIMSLGFTYYPFNMSSFQAAPFNNTHTIRLVALRELRASM